MRPRLSWWKSSALFLGLIVLVVLLVLAVSPVLHHSNGSASSSSTSTAGANHPASGPGISPFLDTWNNIHVFQDFDYNVPASNLTTLAERYGGVWGNNVEHTQALHAANPHMYLGYYIPFNRDWGTYPGYWSRKDLGYWQTNHPDWVLYQCDRRTPALEFGDPNIPLDISNPAVINWQIETYAKPAAAQGYNAIAADNVDLRNYFGACGFYHNGQWVQRYTGQLDDAQWRADVINWVKTMQKDLHALPHPLALIPNFSAGNAAAAGPDVQRAVSAMDGVEDEDGFTSQGTDYVTGDDWVQRVHFMVSVQQQHKAYYLIEQFPSVGRAEIQWALATYLMGKEHAAWLFISPVQGYGTDLWHDEYDAKVGSPLAPMYEQQHVYFRDYSHGLSIVNPSATATYTVTLKAGKSYSDLYGNRVGPTVVMAPHSGMVLLQQ